MKHSAKSKLLSVIMAGMMATSIGAVSASAASLPQIQLQAPQGITVLQDTASKAKTNLQALKDSAPKLSTQFDKTPILNQKQDYSFWPQNIKNAGYGKPKVTYKHSTRKLPHGWIQDKTKYSDGTILNTYYRKDKNGNFETYGDQWKKGNGWSGKVKEYGSPQNPVVIPKGTSFNNMMKIVKNNTKKTTPTVHHGSGRAYKK